MGEQASESLLTLHSDAWDSADDTAEPASMPPGTIRGVANGMLR